MPKYIYQPFEKPNSEFRLLQISKDPLTHQPQYSLLKYNLMDGPEYTALSYTWGEPTPTGSVKVDGENLEVRQNLFDFLHAYVTESWGLDDIGNPVLCWIDQICINQEDLVERSNQVRTMDKIYKQAKRVLVWLGCDPKMIEAARRLRDNEFDEKWPIVTLLAHPYFLRIWIIQEIALSVNLPLIVCGGIELDWDRANPSSRPEQSSHVNPTATAAVQAHGHFWTRHTLQGCIERHCWSNCHDYRDKVYGLLGLTPERWRVSVDYTKEVLEVYFDAVAALFEELFDIKDPECLYPKELTDHVNGNLWVYQDTCYFLAHAMGVPRRHYRGLRIFLEYVEAAYLNTKIRNVQYTYTGRIYTRVRAQSSSKQIPAPEEEIEVGWGSIKATRRNPLLRDVIPEMGLQLASTTVEGTTEQSGDSMRTRDRWWYRHDGKIHYFDCEYEEGVLGWLQRGRREQELRIHYSVRRTSFRALVSSSRINRLRMYM